MASSARPARRYPTDLTNRQWRLVEPLLPAPPAGPAGRPRKHPPREIVNAILYHVRAGGAWRMLPRDFPPWQTVYWYFTLWRTDGTLDRLHDALREQTRAKRSGRQKKDPAPSAGVVDSVTARRGHRGFGLAGLRRREEGERTQEAHRHRHHRLAAGSRGDRGQRAGPRRRTSHPQAAARLSSRRASHLGGRGLRRAARRHRQERLADHGGGGAQAGRAAGILRTAQAMGRRTHPRLDDALAAARPRLRTTTRNP